MPKLGKLKFWPRNEKSLVPRACVILTQRTANERFGRNQNRDPKILVPVKLRLREVVYPADQETSQRNFVLIHRYSLRPEVAWKRASGSPFINMSSSSTPKNSNHKCCAACGNCSDNRADLIILNFPEDEKLKRIWVQKMTRGDSKFASTTSLFSFAKHLVKRLPTALLCTVIWNNLLWWRRSSGWSI